MDRLVTPGVKSPPPIIPLAVKSKTAALMLGISTTKLDELIATGQIAAKQSGKNRLVLVASMQAYLDGLPDAREVSAEPAYRKSGENEAAPA